MKGSQGLDALATLCGGASKALDEEKNQRKDTANQSNQPIGSLPLSQQFSSPSSLMNVSNSNDNSVAQQQQQQPQPQGNSLQHLNPQLSTFLNSGMANQNMVNSNNDNALAFQQMVYLNLLQNQNNNVANVLGSQQAQASTQFVDQNNNALAMVLALQEAASQNNNNNNQHIAQFQQQQLSIAPNHQSPDQNRNSNTLMQQNSYQNTQQSGNNDLHQPILMRHPQVGDSTIGQQKDEGRERSNSVLFSPEDKKMAKRAANRRSAQLSRKRKKQYIEELKDENSDLRRMELILRSIPDLIVSFDSSGKIGFISQSVNKFLAFKPEELEGKSFWDRLCGDSVRLLKAAFMDALAARENDSTSTPLGNGVWELRLQDKNQETIMVTLNGVVHFTGDAPECVCSIRIADGKTPSKKDGLKPMPPPQQSVFGGDDATGEKKSLTITAKAEEAPKKNPRLTAQISDADSNC